MKIVTEEDLYSCVFRCLFLFFSCANSIILKVIKPNLLIMIWECF